MGHGLSEHLQVETPGDETPRDDAEPAPWGSPPEAVPPARPTLAPILAGGVLLGGCVAMAAFDPTGGPVLCPFRAVTGLWCPGCGSTRMLHQLATGHPMGALGMNPLAFVLLPYAVWGVFAALTQWFGGPRWVLPRFSARVIWILFAVVMAFWVLRNIPGAPFDALAPT
jgi:Protein of unknown function (DUF2752)